MRVKTRPPKQRLETTVLRDTQSFASLEEEWEDLYRHSPRTTPFQSWAWLYSWWESYGEDYELRLVTVRGDEGLLVGIIPLMLQRRAGLGRLLLVGTGLTDYLDALCREGWEDDVAEAGLSAIRRMGCWQVADLQALRPEAAAWDVFGRWSGPQARMRQVACPVLEVRPWDELIASLRSRNLRHTARRALRQVGEDGIRRELVGTADVEGAARRLVRLHQESRRERGVGAEHLSRRFESYVVTVARRMEARGLGGISELRRGGETLVSDFWVCEQGNSLGIYLLGASQEAIRRYQWSSLFIWDAVNIALSKDCDRLDFLRGEEPYKLRWSSRVVPNHRLILGRNVGALTLYAKYHALHARAEAYALSGEAPGWIEKAAEVYRVLRLRATLRAESEVK